MFIITSLFAQNNKIVGEAMLKDITRVNNDTIQFDLVLKRLTNDWRYFANCTFHITFDTTQFTFDNTNIILVRDSTGLPQGILSGNSNPIRGYEIRENIYQNKIVISILGPESIEESQSFNLDDEFILGRYKLFTPDHRKIPTDLQWQKPTYYYQATASKIENDSLFDFITLYHKNDNLDLNNQEGTSILFTENYLPFRDSILLTDFFVEYMGQKKLSLSWVTKLELNVVGFTIKRAFKPSVDSDPYSLDYNVIYTWRNDSLKKYNPEMISKGNSKYGFFYGVLPDTIDIRGKEYCYQLFCSFYDSLKAPINKDVFLAQKCVPIPKSMILSAQITSQNPFDDYVEIEFKLSDDCLMTVSVVDMLGKEIGFIKDRSSKENIDNKLMKMGIHTIKFAPMPEVAQGSYYIYLAAYPLNDNSLEISKAVIKVINLK